MKTVFVSPTPSEATQHQTNSINQITLRLQKALPAYGWQLTEDEQSADLVAGHAGSRRERDVDVAICHGLYPTAHNQAEPWWFGANAAVIHNLRVARRISVPSQWVADMLRRDMGIAPAVIPWGIEPSEWYPEHHAAPFDVPYALWNKTRIDAVCDPTPVKELAVRLPQLRFLTTYFPPKEKPTPNVWVSGVQDVAPMQKLIRGAAVYIATTKETFGIGSIEAASSGVPVVGFRHGAILDYIQHGVNGYLVAPDDYDALAQGVKWCLEYRAIVGANARKMAQQYTWDACAARFAALFDDTYEEKTALRPPYTIVIPNFNYERYVVQAIESVKTQVLQGELIVVDDGSTDNSVQVIQDAIADMPNARLIQQANGGVAKARNAGIAAACSELVMCLDADDALGNRDMLLTLVNAMDNPTLGIAYTGLTCMNADGQLADKVNPWPQDFDYEKQLAGNNCVPTCALIRKKAWQRAGGYRTDLQPAEDAALWVRITSLGYHAKQVTKEGWFHYRLHDNSLSSDVRTGRKREPNWRNVPYASGGARPFAAVGKYDKPSYPVRAYDVPVVSVIIPVGPRHVDLVRRALDSVDAQTMREWECIVVNDTGQPLNLLGFSWAKVLEGGAKGQSHARNVGLRAANAPLVTFLDADDVFMPTFLEDTLRVYQRTGRYVYTDWVSLNKAGMYETHETPNWDANYMLHKQSMHSINVLLKRDDALKVGGFDETMHTWEDTDFFLKLVTNGVCGERIPKALMIYDYQSGDRRETGASIESELKELLYNRYKDFIEGRKSVSCCGHTPKGKPIHLLASATAESGKDVRIEYHGGVAPHGVRGAVTGTFYGRRQKGDTFYMDMADALANPEVFRVLQEVIVSEETPLPPAPSLLEESA